MVIFLWVVFDNHSGAFPSWGLVCRRGLRRGRLIFGAGIDNVSCTPCWPVDVDCWGKGPFAVDQGVLRAAWIENPSVSKILLKTWIENDGE